MNDNVDMCAISEGCLSIPMSERETTTTTDSDRQQQTATFRGQVASLYRPLETLLWAMYRISLPPIRKWINNLAVGY